MAGSILGGISANSRSVAPSVRPSITTQIEQLTSLADELANRVNNFESFVQGHPSAGADGTTASPPASISDRLEVINASLRRGIDSIERLSAAF